MDNFKKPTPNRLTDQLPTHKPDDGSWQQLSAKLDALDADAAFHEKLEQLPVYSPDPATWGMIAQRLNRVAYIKTTKRIALMAAAGLLLFFSVSRISDFYQDKPVVPQTAFVETPDNPSDLNNNQDNTIANATQKQVAAGSIRKAKTFTAVIQKDPNVGSDVNNMAQVSQPVMVAHTIDTTVGEGVELAAITQKSTLHATLPQLTKIPNHSK